jgi:hypothetical protein
MWRSLGDLARRQHNVVSLAGLCAGRSVLDLLGRAQSVHRFVDGQEDGRFERAERTAPADRQRDRGHGHVVGGLHRV